ncbi:MAG: 30S ribosomal protein S16 [Bacteroidales bacterium]|jgi:small subunit ribosomal protein S16|nr:30S ribosomal protein S16 [Bacteroidales bacterium]
MPTRIRLQRKGKKGRPFYHVVIADGRAPRDGKFIERIGTYNPIANPAEIVINSDRALYWLQVGAQPSDTVRNILSSQGILLKNHLLIGVKKGAISQAQADAKFDTWFQEKQNKLESVRKAKEEADREARKSRMTNEKKVNEARAEAIAKRLAEQAAAKRAADEAARAEHEAEATVEETPVETADEVVEETVAEAVPVEKIETETSVEEPTAEAPVSEEPVAEKTEEASEE